MNQKGASRIWFGTLAAFVSLAVLAVAHPVEYVFGSARIAGIAPGVCQDEDSPALLQHPGIGVACFDAGHIVPFEDDSSAVIELDDTFFVPTFGFVCQDDDGDGVCGGPGELLQELCSEVRIFVDPWDPDQILFVFPSAPLLGAFSCGLASHGTGGFADHTDG